MLLTEQLTTRMGSKTLIEDISLRFSPGILYGILGPNGSGKSTLLKTLAAIWKPSQGRVSWCGTDLTSLSRKEVSKIVSLVPQNPQVSFDYTVHDIVAMGRYPHGNSTIATLSVEEVLHTVDAWHLRHRPITQISSGERQRVYIARSLLSESPVLLLDEPTSSLDIRHQRDIWHLLKHLVQQGKTIIVTLHDLATTETHCDEIAILNHGRTIAFGPYRYVMTPERMHNVFGI